MAVWRNRTYTFKLHPDYSPFIASVILNNDLVARLSFPSICRLRNEVLDAICRAKTSKMHIMQAIFRDFAAEDLLYEPGQEPDSELKRSIAHYKVCRFAQKLLRIFC